MTTPDDAQAQVDRTLTRAEAVEWVMKLTRSSRRFAVRTVGEAEQGRTPYGMTRDGTHWVVPL